MRLTQKLLLIGIILSIKWNCENAEAQVPRRFRFADHKRSIPETEVKRSVDYKTNSSDSAYASRKHLVKRNNRHAGNSVLNTITGYKGPHSIQTREVVNDKLVKLPSMLVVGRVKPMELIEPDALKNPDSLAYFHSSKVEDDTPSFKSVRLKQPFPMPLVVVPGSRDSNKYQGSVPVFPTKSVPDNEINYFNQNSPFYSLGRVAEILESSKIKNTPNSTSNSKIGDSNVVEQKLLQPDILTPVSAQKNINTKVSVGKSKLSDLQWSYLNLMSVLKKSGFNISNVANRVPNQIPMPLDMALKCSCDVCKFNDTSIVLTTTRFPMHTVDDYFQSQLETTTCRCRSTTQKCFPSKCVPAKYYTKCCRTKCTTPKCCTKKCCPIKICTTKCCNKPSTCCTTPTCPMSCMGSKYYTTPHSCSAKKDQTHGNPSDVCLVYSTSKVRCTKPWCPSDPAKSGTTRCCSTQCGLQPCSELKCCTTKCCPNKCCTTKCCATKSCTNKCVQQKCCTTKCCPSKIPLSGILSLRCRQSKCGCSSNCCSKCCQHSGCCHSNCCGNQCGHHSTINIVQNTTPMILKSTTQITTQMTAAKITEKCSKRNPFALLRNPRPCSCKNGSAHTSAPDSKHKKPMLVLSQPGDTTQENCRCCEHSIGIIQQPFTQVTKNTVAQDGNFLRCFPTVSYPQCQEPVYQKVDQPQPTSPPSCQIMYPCSVKPVNLCLKGLLDNNNNSTCCPKYYRASIHTTCKNPCCHTRRVFHTGMASPSYSCCYCTRRNKNKHDYYSTTTTTTEKITPQPEQAFKLTTVYMPHTTYPIHYMPYSETPGSSGPRMIPCADPNCAAMHIMASSPAPSPAQYSVTAQACETTHCCPHHTIPPCCLNVHGKVLRRGLMEKVQETLNNLRKQLEFRIHASPEINLRNDPGSCECFPGESPSFQRQKRLFRSNVRKRREGGQNKHTPLESLLKIQQQLDALESELLKPHTSDLNNNLTLQIKVCVDVINGTSPSCMDHH